MTKSPYSKMLSLILTLSTATPYVEAAGTDGGTYAAYDSCDSPYLAAGQLCVNRQNRLAYSQGAKVRSGFWQTGRIGGENVNYRSKELSKAELNAMIAARGGVRTGGAYPGAGGTVGGYPVGVYPADSGRGDCDGGATISCEIRYDRGYAIPDMPMSRREWRQSRRAYRKAMRAARRGADGKIIYVSDGGPGGGGGGNIGPGGIIYNDPKADLAIIGPFCDGLPAKIDESADDLKTTDEAIVKVQGELDDLKKDLDEKRKGLNCADSCKETLTKKGNYSRLDSNDKAKNDNNDCYKAPNKSLAALHFTADEYSAATSGGVQSDVGKWLVDSKVQASDFKINVSACVAIFPTAEKALDSTSNKCLDDIFDKNKDGKYTGLNMYFTMNGCSEAEDWMNAYNDLIAKQKVLAELTARKDKLTSRDKCKIKSVADADDDKWKGSGTACLESLKDSCTTTIDALIALANNPNNGRCLECEAQQAQMNGMCMMFGTCGMSKAAQVIGAIGGIVTPLAGGLMNMSMYNSGLAACMTMYSDHLNVAQQIGQPPSAPGCGGMMGMGGGFGGGMGGMGGMMNPMMMGGMGGMMNPMMMGGMMNPMMMGGMMNPMMGAGLNLSLGAGMGGFPGFAGGMYGPGMMNPMMMGGMGGMMNPMMMGGMGGMMNPMMMGGMGGMMGPNMANQMGIQNQMQTSLMQMQQSALQQASLQNAMMYSNAGNMYGGGGMGMSPYYSMGVNPMMSMYGGGGMYPGMYGGGYGYPYGGGLSGGLNFNAGFNLGGYGGLYGY